MIDAGDFLPLPYTPDLTQAGIAYACRSLAHTYDRMGGSQYWRMRRIVVGIGVELAFRRYLAEQGVEHDVLGVTPFTEPDRYDVALGGRRCDLKSYLLYRKKRIRRIRKRPDILLEAHALIPDDQIQSDHLRDEDIYIFSFLTALVTPTKSELKRAVEAEQPVFLIHPLAKQWASPSHWGSLGDLVMKTDLDKPLELDLGGMDGERAFVNERVHLVPRSRTPVKTTFHTISYMHVPRMVEGQVGIHSPVLDATYIVETHQWGNIWVYGMQIIMVGYMSRGEFRRKATHLPAGSQVLQYPHTRTENRMLPVRELHPLSDLFVRAQNWSQIHRRR